MLRFSVPCNCEHFDKYSRNLKLQNLTQTQTYLVPKRISTASFHVRVFRTMPSFEVIVMHRNPSKEPKSL